MPNIGDVIRFKDIRIGDTVCVTFLVDDLTRSRTGLVDRVSDKAARTKDGQVIASSTPEWRVKDYTITLVNRPVCRIPTEAGSRGAVRTQNSAYWASGYVIAEDDYSYAVLAIWDDGSYGRYDLDGVCTYPPGSDQILEWIPEEWPDKFSKQVNS